MAELEYKIGYFDPDDTIITKDKEDVVLTHRFVIEKNGSVVLIYVDKASSYSGITKKFGLDEDKIVGGGSLYLNRNNEIVLDDICIEYGTPSKKAAELFALQLIGELLVNGIKSSTDPKKRTAININGCKPNPPETMMNDFWKEQK